jgi:polyribonucleotide nucleotidyltransferase
MIECDAREIPADKIKEAFKLGQAEIDASCDMQSEFIAKLTINPKEITYNKPGEDVIARVSGIINSEKLQAMTGNTKVSFNDLYYTYEKEVLELAKEKMAEDTDGHFTYSKVKMAVFDVVKKFIRHRTIAEGIRIDNRTPEDIRPIYCEVDLLPRVHGSALFRRGDTQILSTVTLGAPGDTETQESMEEDDVKKRYMHHYNFPPFSVNEARGMRGPGRREIGHGRLAEKALEYMIPDAETSPYVIRVVSECMGSGGSTSMGSVCGSTMSLMAAGVKLIKPVAGIAMGLMSETDEAGNI